ncbi:MAG: FAD-dependent monooxygenase [Gemmatimonadales bacterium]
MSVYPGLLDVLVVGAGPTGLTLAAQLRAFGVRFRIIDRALDRGEESRALAVQARSLEVLQALGLGETLVSRGNPSVRLAIHFESGTVAAVRLAEFGATDTRFPFILLVSQAQTEAVLGDHLAAAGVTVERGLELVSLTERSDEVGCVIRDQHGREEPVRARYVVGCDGAHSTVRKEAGIQFEGGAYLQDFVLGDVEVDGALERDTLHSFVGRRGVAMFFPLGSPATWRIIAMAGSTPDRSRHGAMSTGSMTSKLSLTELQDLVDGATGGGLQLRDPVWLTHFHLHHRQARHYRAGRVFLAGDAAHIHSPVGGQGMNTGMQDAWNVGWKLALVARGAAYPSLLDSYEAERWPVGRILLRSTDRVFGIFTRAMSATPLTAWARRTVGSLVIPRVVGSRRLRALLFHFVSQLGIRYRRSPAVMEGRPRLRAGPRAGDRLPDAPVSRDGEATFLQQETSGPCLHLLLCGEGWEPAPVAELVSRYPGLLDVRYLRRRGRSGLIDAEGVALTRLAVHASVNAAQYLIRPDGHIGFRCAGRDLREVERYLSRMYRGPHPGEFSLTRRPDGLPGRP